MQLLKQQRWQVLSDEKSTFYENDRDCSRGLKENCKRREEKGEAQLIEKSKRFGRVRRFAFVRFFVGFGDPKFYRSR